MGRDKARARIGGRTMLARVREIAATTGLRVSVIRRDAVRRCGPLGGIITGFRRSRADALLFLACDMPFITPALLQRVLNASHDGVRSVFASTREGEGFPFLLPRSALPIVEQQVEREEFSLRKLARSIGSGQLRVSPRAVININTPEELERTTGP